MNRKVEYEGLRGAVALAHHFLKSVVRNGDRVVDATCGNGSDTLLLAQLVGRDGRVWAFDVQEQALAKSRSLLAEAGCLEQVELLAAGHECLADFVAEPLKAVVFNLGYLPGGEKGIITRPQQTIAALNQALGFLLPGGIITVCIYTGHPGGAEEGETVAKWGAALSARHFNVWTSRQANRSPTAPYLLLVEKS